MSQRSFFLVAVLLLLLIGGLATGLVVLLRQEPAWYNAAAVPPGAERMALFSQATQAFLNLQKTTAEDREWGGQFTDRQINGYLEEAGGGARHDGVGLPDGITQPRVAFERDHIKLAFRYSQGIWSSVVSIDLHVWLPANEPNVIALELDGFYAGSLPISAQSLLEEIAEMGRKKNIEVNWYRHKGHPVALLRLQPDQPRPSFQLQALHLQEHMLTIQGRSLDQPTAQPSDPAPALPSAAP